MKTPKQQGRKPLSEDHATVQLNVRVTADIVEKINRLADFDGISQAQMVRRILANFLKRNRV